MIYDGYLELRSKLLCINNQEFAGETVQKYIKGHQRNQGKKYNEGSSYKWNDDNACDIALWGGQVTRESHS